MDDQFDIEQYRQCYEDSRQLWILFWRIPTIAVTISAGIFAAVFIYLWPNKQWIESGTILFISHILTLVLAFVANKHRYFGSIWYGTLAEMEEDSGFTHRVQRTSFPESDVSTKKPFWFTKTPKWYRSPSGEKMLIFSLVIISFISLGFSMFAFFQQSPCAFWIALLAWFVILSIWLILSGFTFKSNA